MQGRPRSLLIQASCQCGVTNDIRFLPASVTRFPEGRLGPHQARSKRRTTPRWGRVLRGPLMPGVSGSGQVRRRMSVGA